MSSQKEQQIQQVFELCFPASGKANCSHLACYGAWLILTQAWEVCGGIPTMEGLLDVANARSSMLRLAERIWEDRYHECFPQAYFEVSWNFWIVEQRLGQLPDETRQQLGAYLDMVGWNSEDFKTALHQPQQLIEEILRAEGRSELAQAFGDRIEEARKACFDRWIAQQEANAADLGLTTDEIAFFKFLDPILGPIEVLRNAYRDGWILLGRARILPESFSNPFDRDRKDPVTPLMVEELRRDTKAIQEPKFHRGLAEFLYAGYLEQMSDRYSEPPSVALVESFLRFLQMAGVTLEGGGVVAYEGEVPGRPGRTPCTIFVSVPFHNGYTGVLTVNPDRHGGTVLFVAEDLVHVSQARLEDRFNVTRKLEPEPGSGVFPWNGLKMLLGASWEKRVELRKVKTLDDFLATLIRQRRG